MERKYYFLSHVGAWLIMILPSYLLKFGGFEEVSNDHLIVYSINSLFTILNFYFFFSLIIPQLYDRKRTNVLLIITLVFLIIYPLLQYEIFHYLHEKFEVNWKRIKHKDYFLSQAYTTTVLYTGVAYLSYFTIKWVREKQKQADLMTQNQASELALLRSQINPHFLFNTLNNIYSLVLKKSDVAPEAMMKLSDIMRYMLYETNTDRVPLEKEINYLESYIELMQLRLTQKEFVTFKIVGDLINQEVAPMLLVPFVENAFKHADKKVKAPGITILLKIEVSQIEFSVKNFRKKEKQKDMSTSGGIGLQNIKRRLNLLYENRHNLLIDEKDNEFYIRLEIKC